MRNITRAICHDPEGGFRHLKGASAIIWPISEDGQWVAVSFDDRRLDESCRIIPFHISVFQEPEKVPAQ